MLSLITVSCSKEKSDSTITDITGKWMIDSVELYYDDEKINYNPNTNCIAYLDSDGLVQLGYASTWSMQFQNQSFNDLTSVLFCIQITLFQNQI